MIKTITKRLYSIAIMAVGLIVWGLTVATMQACANNDDDMLNASYNTETVMAYTGKWQVGSSTAPKSTILKCAKYFQLSKVPCDEIFAQLYPGKTITDARCNMGVELLLFDSMSPSGKSILYSLKPTTWTLMASVDGESHKVQLAISPISEGSNELSWGSLSKTGVLTIILHATSATIDDDTTRPLSLTLTFTGK
ncbi:MAG: hypothetical protein MR933_05525 [Prevotella sp.]|uniref:hypothetical protein n=1 Tax=Prevotella sp. TaxID=59823 RepID=UPI0025DC9660|nr:hypothetical protein [Prevotella sp.]MCI7119237.1 hypothetical protein [Prevotella sp.]